MQNANITVVWRWDGYYEKFTNNCILEDRMIEVLIVLSLFMALLFIVNMAEETDLLYELDKSYLSK